MCEKVDDKIIIYARLAYYILKMPLFTSIMLAAINKYKLPETYQIYAVKSTLFSLSIDKCIEENYKKAAEFIPEGRKLFIDIINGKSKVIIPYRKDWYDNNASVEE